jgi:hypothetical protein
MKWEVVSSNANQELYELWHNEKKLLTLDYHPFTSSARINYPAERRVFLIRKEGFLRNKTVLRNEYGVRIGQLGYDKGSSQSGTLELNDEKFNYRFHNNSLSELIVYKNSPDIPFVTCVLKGGNENPSIQFNNETKLSPLQHFLLMALCWYMLLPVAKENIVDYSLQ